MRSHRDGAPAIAFTAAAACFAAGAFGACVVPAYEVTSSAGPGGSGGTSSATMPSTSGSGGSTSSHGGSGGTTSSGTGGVAGTGGAGGTGGSVDEEWRHTYGGTGDEHAFAVAVGTKDGIALGGSLGSDVEFSPGVALTWTGLSEGYAVHLSSAAVADWALLFPSGDRPDTSLQAVRAVAIDSEGSMIVAGYFYDKVLTSVGGVTLFSAGAADVFVAKYDSTGTSIWEKRFGGPLEDSVEAIALNSAGEVFVVGSFQGMANFAGTDLTAEASFDGYVVKLAANGMPGWAKQLKGGVSEAPTSIAVDTAGNITVAGYYSGSMSWDLCMATNKGGTDAFVLHLDAAGGCLWLKSFGDMSNQRTLAVAAGPDDDVYIAGYFEGTINLGGGDDVNPGVADLFAARFHPNGDFVWSKVIKDHGIQSRLGLALAPGGGLALAGSFASSTDFGSGQAIAAKGTDAFVVRLAADNSYLWHKVYTGAGFQAASAAAFDSTGALIVAGDFEGLTDFGDGSGMVTPGGSDVFLAKNQAVKEPPYMATNLAIDDKLLEEALRVGRHRTKKATVTEALREYIQRREQGRITELFGKVELDPEYDYKQQRRRR